MVGDCLEGAPDTPQVASAAEWDIAHGLFDPGVPFNTIRLAFMLAYLRRYYGKHDQPPPIPSPAYFRTVAPNLTR